MKHTPVRVLIVDDHAILRSGLRLMLEGMTCVQGVDEAGSCLTALNKIAANPPEMVLMDSHMPEIDGIEGTRRILSQYPNIKVIMLSGDSNVQLIVDALQAGARAYVIKENSPEEIAHAIQAVQAGKGYFSPEVAAAIAKHFRETSLTPPPPKASLSEQEKRLLQLIAQGQRNKEIADHLNLSTKSVEAYRSRLMAKLGCASPAELTRYAIREGIAEL
jgi:DNA-binding NarL/FixJ family response regulator